MWSWTVESILANMNNSHTSVHTVSAAFTGSGVAPTKWFLITWNINVFIFEAKLLYIQTIWCSIHQRCSIFSLLLFCLPVERQGNTFTPALLVSLSNILVLSFSTVHTNKHTHSENCLETRSISAIMDPWLKNVSLFISPRSNKTVEFWHKGKALALSDPAEFLL